MNRPRTPNVPRDPDGLGTAARLMPYALSAALLLGLGRGGRLRRALRQSRSALQATRAQLDTIMDRVPVGLVQTDLRGRVLLANDRFCGLVGHRPLRLRTMRLHDMTHPDDRTRHQERHTRMLATGQPFEIESRLVRADDSHVWVISHMAVTRDADGRPLHVVAAVQDISDRRAAEAAMRDLQGTLDQRVQDAVAERVANEAAMRETMGQAQRMEALGQLAGGVAHDFNNVLQAIAGGARLIQRRLDDPAAVARLAGLVVDAAERGASVTQRLLAFARRGPLQPGPVDVATLLLELQPMLSDTFGARMSVRVAVPDGLPPVMADRMQLEAVLVGLATNAVDAVLDTPGQHVLTLAAAVDDGAGLPAGQYVRIDVDDTGPGMDAETLAHAMEPFFTTKPRGRGTGLGLAVARGFAEQSGGRLVLQSALGTGTTASLILPAPNDAPAT